MSCPAPKRSLTSKGCSPEFNATPALGATAGRSLFGTKVRVTKDRGRLLESPLAPVAALTLHPSAILRLRDHDEREDAMAALVDDLSMVAAAIAEVG